MDTLRFAIGDENIQDIKLLKGMLQSKGHQVVCEELDGPSLLRKARSLLPDFIIVGYGISGMTGLEIARIVQGDRLAPVLLTAESSRDVFVRDMGSEYFPFIIKPFSEAQLFWTVDFVYNNYKKMVGLEKEVLELKNKLETRKVVEKAKGILIDTYNMKEKDAFRYLQKRSMDECRPVIEIARRIIDKNSE